MCCSSLKTKNSLRKPIVNKTKKRKRTEKGNATITFFTSIWLVLSNEKQNRITVPIKLAKLCLLFIKFAKVQSIYSKSKASRLLAAKQLQRTPYDTEWWLIRGTFRWSIVNGGFHMHVAIIIYLIAIWVYKSYCCFLVAKMDSPFIGSLDKYQYMLIFEPRRQNKRVATSSHIGLIYVLTKIRSQYERKIRELSSYVQ